MSAIIAAPPAEATRTSKRFKASLQQVFPESRIRLDGVLEARTGNLYLPLIPKGVESTEADAIGLRFKFPEKDPFIYGFQNGWCYLKISQRIGKKVLMLPAGLPEPEKKRLTGCRLPQDLIVPKDMFVSADLKSALGELTIPVLEAKDVPAADPKAVVTDVFDEKPADTATTPASTTSSSKTPANSSSTRPAVKTATTPPSETKNSATTTATANQVASVPHIANIDPTKGIIAITSPQTGKIALLGSKMEKLAELPTDGTPGGMEFCAGKVFVADQTKNRVLMIDPNKREFAGQIDFPPGSGPKDVAAMSNGTFLYISEGAANKVACLELSTMKILMHTLVPAGPTRIKLTPNDYTLIVLNTSAGKVTFISTLNQKVLAIAAVGNMPSDVVISSDSRLAFVSNRLSNTVSVIDITQRKVIKTLEVGNGPTGLAVTRDGERLFVANAKDNSISVFEIKTMNKVTDVQLPIDVEFPGDIMLMPDGKHILISSAATDTLGVLNSETLEFEKQPTLGCTSVDMLWIPLAN